MFFDTFLFDLDGTLVDSTADLARAINLLREDFSLAPLDISTVRTYVGDGATMLVTRALPEGCFSQKRLERFLNLYRSHLLDQTQAYPGIEAFLEAHRNKKLAVVTNKPYRLSVDLLKGLGILSYFDLLVGAETCPRKKPHPDPVLHVLDELRTDAASAVMIGDHHTDLRAGQAAGVKTCFCAYGIGHHDGIPFDFLAETPDDLRHLFFRAPP
jgi:phosphoglycolate phosphatase